MQRETFSALNIQVMCNQASRYNELKDIREDEAIEIDKVQSRILVDVKSRERILLALKFILDTDLLLKLGDNQD